MTSAKMLGLGLLVAALAATGCDKKPEPTKAAQKKGDGKEDDHVHGKGPNGGVVFDFGKHHAEFTVDHDKKECTLSFLGMDEKTPTPVAAKDVTVTTKEAKAKDGTVVPPMTIKLAATDEKDGKATTFVGTDPGLGNVAEFEGAVNGVLDAKPSKGEFKE